VPDTQAPSSILAREKTTRQSREDKGETRQRILDSAGRLFKADGIDGTGIAGLMADAGLTNGAFYKHFGSKDDLVAHTVADQLALQQRIVDALPPAAPESRSSSVTTCPRNTATANPTDASPPRCSMRSAAAPKASGSHTPRG
jgi:AcrR family transcriptional regulator